mgnify:CR=1 FL=1
MPAVRGVIEMIIEDEKGYTLYIGGRSYRAIGVRKPHTLREGDSVVIEYEPRILDDKTVIDVIVKPPIKMRVIDKVPTVKPELLLEGIYNDYQELKNARLKLIHSVCTLYAGTSKSIEEVIQAVKQLETRLLASEGQAKV